MRGRVSGRQQGIGELSEHGKGGDGRENGGRLAGHLPIDEEKAQALRSAHELGGDDEHPAQAQAGAQARDVGGQNRRKDHACDERQRRQAHDAAGLDQLAVAIAHGHDQSEIDREEHADRDQHDFRRLENREPEDEQRHPGDRRHIAQRLQGRVEQLADQRHIARQRADHRCGHRAEQEAEADAHERRLGMHPQFAFEGQVPQRREDAAGRRHEPRRDEAKMRGGFVDQRDGDRQEKSEQRRGARMPPLGPVPARGVASRHQLAGAPQHALRRGRRRWRLHPHIDYRGHGPRPQTRSQRRRHLIACEAARKGRIDQRRRDGLHVDFGLDDAGLLQGEAGGFDRLQLRLDRWRRP